MLFLLTLTYKVDEEVSVVIIEQSIWLCHDCGVFATYSLKHEGSKLFLVLNSDINRNSHKLAGAGVIYWK